MSKKKQTLSLRDATRNEYTYLHKVTINSMSHVLSVTAWLLVAFMISVTIFILVVAIRNNVLDNMWYGLIISDIALLVLSGHLFRKARHTTEHAPVLSIEGILKKSTQQLGKYSTTTYYIGEYPVAIPSHWLKEKHLHDGLTVNAEVFPVKSDRLDAAVSQASYTFICLRLNEAYSIDQEVEKGLLRLKKNRFHLVTTFFMLLFIIYSLLLIFGSSPFEYNLAIFISLLVLQLLLLYRSYRIFRYNRKILKDINQLHQE